MKKLVLSLLFVAFVWSSLPGWAADAPAAIPEQVIDVRYDKCPVMGGMPQNDVTLLKDGKLYHFCCPGCVGPFEKNFKTKVGEIKNPSEVNLMITNVDGKSPVSGEAAVADVFRVEGDSITFFSSKDDMAKFVSQQPSGVATPTAPAGHGDMGGGCGM